MVRLLHEHCSSHWWCYTECHAASEIALRQDETVFQDRVRKTKLPFGRTKLCSKMVFDRKSTVGGPCPVPPELLQHLTQPLTSHFIPSLALAAKRVWWPDSQDVVQHASS